MKFDENLPPKQTLTYIRSNKKVNPRLHQLCQQIKSLDRKKERKVKPNLNNTVRMALSQFVKYKNLKNLNKSMDVRQKHVKSSKLLPKKLNKQIEQTKSQQLSVIKRKKKMKDEIILQNFIKNVHTKRAKFVYDKQKRDRQSLKRTNSITLQPVTKNRSLPKCFNRTKLINHIVRDIIPKCANFNDFYGKSKPKNRLIKDIINKSKTKLDTKNLNKSQADSKNNITHRDRSDLKHLKVMMGKLVNTHTITEKLTLKNKTKVKRSIDKSKFLNESNFIELSNEEDRFMLHKPHSMLIPANFPIERKNHARSSVSFIEYNKKARKLALPKFETECKKLMEMSFVIIKDNVDIKKLISSNESITESDRSNSQLSDKPKKDVNAIFDELKSQLFLDTKCPSYLKGYFKNLTVPYSYQSSGAKYNSYWMDCISRLLRKDKLSGIKKIGYYRALYPENKKDIKNSVISNIEGDLPFEIKTLYKNLNLIKIDILNDHDHFAKRKRVAF